MARKYQLHGAFPSKAGDSAYEVAQKNGFEGTEQEWLKSLTGPKGNPGPQGISGIHIGTEPPVNDDVTVWINPDDDGSFESVEYYETDLTIETESSDIALNTPCPIADFHELHIHLTTNQNPFELCMDVGGEHTSLINTPSGTNAGVHILLAASHDRSMMNLCVQSAANTDNAQSSVPDRTAAVQNEAASLRLYSKDNSVSFMPGTQIRAWGVYRSQGTGVLKIKNIETGEWETVKTLKGDKGEKGEKGDKGDVGTVPVASPDTLGGVQPVEKTESMTNPVGVDALGGLWSAGGSDGEWRLAKTVVFDTAGVSEILITEDDDGKPLNCKECYWTWHNPKTSTGTSRAWVELNRNPMLGLNGGLMGTSGQDLYVVWHVVRLGRLAYFESWTSNIGFYNFATQYFKGMSIFELENITAIRFRTDNQNVIGVGATLKLYVRE